MSGPRGPLKNLHILHWNCKSLNSKLSEFKDFLYEDLPDVVALQETWLNKGHEPKFIAYDSIRQDRSVRGGGGVMFIIHKSIFYRVKQLKPFQGGTLEIQCITIKMANSELDIINTYRTGPTLNNREFEHYLNQVQTNYIICGDINGHHQLWEPNRTQPNDATGNVLYNILETNDNIVLPTPPGLPT